MSQVYYQVRLGPTRDGEVDLEVNWTATGGAGKHLQSPGMVLTVPTAGGMPAIQAATREAVRADVEAVARAAFSAPGFILDLADVEEYGA